MNCNSIQADPARRAGLRSMIASIRRPARPGPTELLTTLVHRLAEGVAGLPASDSSRPSRPFGIRDPSLDAARIPLLERVHRWQGKAAPKVRFSRYAVSS
jgi:hypothetical protein